MASVTYVTYEESHPENQLVKCVVVGDTGVGKTRLICGRACGTSYSLKQLMQTHAPTVWAIDHYRKDKDIYEKSWCTVDNVRVSLQLWDTFGYHDKDRKFAYAKADVVLVCFSVVRPRSLSNVIRHWLPEIRNSSSGVPMILCGTQIDLRYLYMDPDFIKHDKGPFFKEIIKDDIITPDIGRATSKEMGAAGYYETSVLVPFGISHVFENVIRVALAYKREKHFWNILNNSLKRVGKPLVQEPYLTPRPVMPKLVVPDDDWPADMCRLLADDTYCDVVFKTKTGQTFSAHKIVITTALPSLQELMDMKRPAVKEDKCHRSSSRRPSMDPETVGLLEEEASREKAECGADPEEFFLDHAVFHSVTVSACGPSVVVLRDHVSGTLFGHVLRYMYTWRCDDSLAASAELIAQLHKLAEMMDFQQLLRYLTNINYNEEYLNMNLTSASIKIHQHKLLEYGLRQGWYADVVFEVEGGTVAAHKALLVNRSDVMACMFSNNFMESSAKVVQFPGVSKHVFVCLLKYLYTGSLCDLATPDLLEVMKLANRLCLGRLRAVVEDTVVRRLEATEAQGGEIYEDAVMLLEPAQLHNGEQLASWCLWYLSCNYLTLHKKHGKLKQSLTPDNQVLLSQRRWPPVWYLKEYDYYEKCQLDLERQKKVAPSLLCYHNPGAAAAAGGGAADNSSLGCLGFCSRRRRRIKYTRRIEESVSV